MGRRATGVAGLPGDLIRAAVERAMSYPFKIWGFGEDIALRALQEYSVITGEPEPAEFVRDLVRPWCLRTAKPTPADHVAPGVPILDLYEQTSDPVYARAAERLGVLYESFGEVDGIPVHRPDLPGLNSLIWVDCLALDGPFLARGARLLQRDDWLALAERTLRAYTDALLDEDAALFRHGFDVLSKRRSDCNWGRGNGWAMHGLVDTLEWIPEGRPARTEFADLLRRQVDAVAESQDESGLWHTILDDPASPLENSTAALFASAVLKARRLGLLDEAEPERLDTMLDRAAAALLGAVEGDGGLPISHATPVGARETYVDAPLGVFPWGQGPLILTFTEARRAADALQSSSTGGEAPQATASGGQQG